MKSRRELRIGFVTAILGAALQVASPLALADALSDVSVVKKGNCANGSPMLFLSNANTSRVAIVSVTRTILVTGKSVATTATISLQPVESRKLGCGIQDSPPATNIPFNWQVKSAHYQ